MRADRSGSPPIAAGHFASLLRGIRPREEAEAEEGGGGGERQERERSRNEFLELGKNP